MFCDVKFCARSQIRRDYFHPTIFLHGDIFLFVSQPYELCLTHIFDLYLGMFTSLTLPSKTASLWLFCLCSLADRRDYFHPTIFWHGDIFFCVCDPNTGTFENWLSTVKALRPHSARYARFVPPAFGRWRGLRWDNLNYFRGPGVKQGVKWSKKLQGTWIFGFKPLFFS